MDMDLYLRNTMLCLDVAHNDLALMYRDRLQESFTDDSLKDLLQHMEEAIDFIECASDALKKEFKEE